MRPMSAAVYSARRNKRRQQRRQWKGPSVTDLRVRESLQQPLGQAAGHRVLEHHRNVILLPVITVPLRRGHFPAGSEPRLQLLQKRPD